MESTDGRGSSPRLARVSRAQEGAILAALGDPQSRALLQLLNDAPRPVQELLNASGLPQASIYRKLRELQDAGLVGIQRSVLAADGHRTDLFRALLVRAEIRFQGSSVEVFASFRDLAAERLSDMWGQVRSQVNRS